MLDFFRTTSAQLVFGLTTLLVLSMIGTYVVLRFRDSIESKETTNDLKTKFREMHQQGYLNEAEYRTITTDLNRQLSRELERRGNTGGGRDDRGCD